MQPLLEACTRLSRTTHDRSPPSAPLMFIATLPTFLLYLPASPQCHGPGLASLLALGKAEVDKITSFGWHLQLTMDHTLWSFSAFPFQRGPLPPPSCCNTRRRTRQIQCWRRSSQGPPFAMHNESCTHFQKPSCSSYGLELDQSGRTASDPTRLGKR